MKSWFLRREYLGKLISAGMDKIKFSNIKRKSNSKIQKGTPKQCHTTLCLYHSLALLIIIFFYFIWIKKLKGHLLHNRVS